MIKPDCAARGIPANDQFSGVPATGRHADLGIAGPRPLSDALAAMPDLRNRLLADRLDDVLAELESDDLGLGACSGLRLNYGADDARVEGDDVVDRQVLGQLGLDGRLDRRQVLTVVGGDAPADGG